MILEEKNIGTQLEEVAMVIKRDHISVCCSQINP